MSDVEPNRAKLLLVDDRPENLLALEAILEPLDTDLVRAASGEEALRRLLVEEFAAILLDVQMPGMDGFQTAELIKGRDRTRHVPILFLTALSKDAEHIFRGYSAGAVDYLLKPFGEERFAEALSRARARLLTQESLPVEALVAEARPRTGPLERVLIRDGSQVHVIPVAQIDFIEAQDDYVCFKANGRDYLKDQTMAAVEATLDPARFVRIHRSYLLNIERIARVELYAKDSRVAVLRDGRRLPVSRSGYARLSKLL